MIYMSDPVTFIKSEPIVLMNKGWQTDILLLECKNKFYVVDRVAANGFIVSEDLTFRESYDNLLSALVEWKIKVDNLKSQKE